MAQFRHLSSNSEIRPRLEALRTAVTPILANNLLPHFTDHSVVHSDRLANLVDGLLENVQKGLKPLNDRELFILYAACYLHDIGLQYESAFELAVPGISMDAASWSALPDAEKRALLRKHHAEISAKMVELSTSTSHPPIGFQLIVSDEPAYIACVCRAHTVWLPDEAALYDRLVSSRPGIDLRMISGLLRVADILDEVCDRALDHRARTLFLDLTAQIHWWRHYSTREVNLNRHENLITISFDYYPPHRVERHPVVRQLQMPYIQAELDCHTLVFARRGMTWVLQDYLEESPSGQLEAIPDDVFEEMKSTPDPAPSGSAPLGPAPSASGATNGPVVVHLPEVDISRVDQYAPDNLVGREKELEFLDEAWEKAVHGDPHRPHVVTYVALGGEGKTSLVAKWLAQLADRGWEGCEAAFAWSFYSQGSRDQAAVSSDLFLSEALRFFGDPEMAANPASAFDKARRLAKLVGDKRAILVLDGLEPLQFPPGPPMDGHLKDQAVGELLKKVAASSKGLCLVTTRVSVVELKNFRSTSAPEIHLRRLSEPAGVALLRALGVLGIEKELKELVEEVKGHALTLNLIGTFLARAYRGDIRQKDKIKFEKADANVQNGHAFRAMAAYERWLLDAGEEGRREVAILRLMGLFDRPAEAGCLGALRAVSIPDLTEPIFGLSDEDWDLALSSLEEAKLVTVNREAGSHELISLDTHPLIREYFAKSLREQAPEAWRAGHEQLYRFLANSTEEGDEPTLEQLQPLYQAVQHGCLAGLQQQTCEDVYAPRICKGRRAYAVKKIGAFGADLGAVACFFDAPWTTASSDLTESYRSWCYGIAAFRLRALGRLKEALQPMRVGLKMRVAQEDWRNASASSGNLSELELTLGDIRQAQKDAELSVEYADRSEDEFQRMGMRTTLADVLHQAGKRQDAQRLFEEAEGMQSARQPHYPLLYSLQGYQYCDLLLSRSEIGAWKCDLQGVIEAGGKEAEVCRHVEERATKTLRWMVENKMALLDIALNHLTLGRSMFCRSILEETNFDEAERELNTAVEGLRKAGRQDHLPWGLLSRSWLHANLGHLNEAQADLDEAWEIAERGPMPLHLADIHLHRCRLFHAFNPYPWPGGPKHDLAEARRLIEKHGYLRRKEELEDAEEAAKTW